MRDKYNIVIGFDFGTSFSKVVIRDQNRQIAEVIQFPSTGRDATSPLLPTVIAHHDDMLWPTFGSAPHGHICYLKMLTSGGSIKGFESSPGHTAFNEAVHEACNAKEGAVNLLAWYFAHVLEATSSFLETSRRFADVRWDGLPTDDNVSVQVGLPAEDLDGTPLTKVFQEAIELGYLLRGSVDPEMREPMGVADWYEACDLAREASAEFDMSNFCYIYPEVAAGIQAVLRSPTAQDGVYITMDVGAGTVDLNTFWRFTGIDDLPIDYLSCDVVPLGAQVLKNSVWSSPYSAYSMLSSASETDSLARIDESEMGAQLGQRIVQLVRHGQLRQRNNNHDRGLRTWDHPRVYAWGGGNNIPIYEQTLLRTLASKADIAHPDVLHLPVPDDIDPPDDIDFGRLAIAYGLSIHPANLEDIRFPRELPIMEPETLVPRKRLDELKPGDPGYSWTKSWND